MTDDNRQTKERLEKKIMLLSQAIWEARLNNEEITRWLEQFQEAEDVQDDEQVHALFLLSHFLYFGQLEIRSLLKHLYRDVIKSPILHEIRRNNSNTMDTDRIHTIYRSHLERVRFSSSRQPF